MTPLQPMSGLSARAQRMLTQQRRSISIAPRYAGLIPQAMKRAPFAPKAKK